MKKSITIFIWLIIIANLSLLKASQWSSYFSYTNCFQVDETKTHWVGATEVGLIMVAKVDNSISTYTKVNGLSDFGISAIKGHENYLFVGYVNGNIDIVEEGRVFNINDIKLVQGIVSKKINNFYFKDEFLYCSTDFGVVVVDLTKREIKDTYYIGDDASYVIVNKVVDDGAYFYAATEEGLLKAAVTAPDIHIYTSWKQISEKSESYTSLSILNSKIFATKRSVEGKNVITSIEIYEEDNIISVPDITNFITIDVFEDLLYVIYENSIDIYNESFDLINTIDDVNLIAKGIRANFVSFIKSEDKYVIADKNNGVLCLGEDWSRFLPMGPSSNKVWSLSYAADKLWVMPGGITTSWNNENLAASASVLSSKGWMYLSRESYFGGAPSRDLVGVAYSNKFPDYVFINSFGSGVFQMDVKADKINLKNHFFRTDGGLENIFENDSHFVRVATSTIDDKGILWMTNPGVENLLVAYDIKQNKWHRFNYGGFSVISRVDNLISLTNGDLWFVSHTRSNEGLVAVRTNGDLANSSMHSYKSFIHPSVDDDKRNKGQMLIVDNEGSEVTQVVNSIVEDKNGHLWLGTDRGVLVNYQPQQVFNQEVPVFSRIKVPRNDGTDYADYLFENDVINVVVVDAANRKWIGTQEIGAMLISPDGQKIIEEFNVNNSPLPSNFVKTITIDNKTGEVFFGTDNGIVSYRGTAIEGQKTFDKIIAFPNPVRPEYQGDVTIKGLMDNSNVKITDVAGNLVYETVANSGQVFWNRKNLFGNDVKSGIYLVFVASESGEYSSVTKIAIIK